MLRVSRTIVVERVSGVLWVAPWAAQDCPPCRSISASDVVRKLIAGEVVSAALINFRQHGRVPFVPLRHDPVVDILAALFQVGALHRILDDVEEERVVEDLQILVVAVARRPLGVRLVAPEQLARDRRRVPVSIGSRLMPSGGRPGRARRLRPPAASASSPS